MGADTDDTINRLFDTLLERFQQAIETSNDNGSEFTDESVALLYYHFQKITFSHNWFRIKGATINPKNEKDNECFRWPITSRLN